ncbi:MAG: hypothetical protein ACRDQ7_11225 [Haloechinothrix sp.]
MTSIVDTVDSSSRTPGVPPTDTNSGDTAGAAGETMCGAMNARRWV